MERGMGRAKKRQISRDMQGAQEEDRGLAVEKRIRAGSICEKVWQLYRQNFYKWWSCASLYCDNEKQVIANLHQHYENNYELQNKSTISLKRNGSQQQQEEKERGGAPCGKKKKTARTKITIQRAGEGRESKSEGERKNVHQSSEQPACYQHLNHSWRFNPFHAGGGQLLPLGLWALE